jgi:hypothetical protein
LAEWTSHGWHPPKRIRLKRLFEGQYPQLLCNHTAIVNRKNLSIPAQKTAEIPRLLEILKFKAI